MLALIFLIISSSAVFGNEDETDIEQGWISGNAIFDSVVKDIRNHIIDLRNFSSVSLPRLEKSMQTMGGVAASLTASEGVLSDLTTVHRLGDVRMRSHGDSVLVYARVALDTLRVVFHHYTLRLGVVPKSGDRLALNVSRNVFDAVFKLHFQGQSCSLSLQGLKVSEMKQMKVDISGFSIFNFIGRLVATWFVEYFNDLVHEIAETLGRSTVNNAIKHMGICEQILDKALFGMAGDIGENGSFNQNSFPLQNRTFGEPTGDEEDIFLLEDLNEDLKMNIDISPNYTTSFGSAEDETCENVRINYTRVDKAFGVEGQTNTCQSLTKISLSSFGNQSDDESAVCFKDTIVNDYLLEDFTECEQTQPSFHFISLPYLNSPDEESWQTVVTIITIYFIFLLCKISFQNK